MYFSIFYSMQPDGSNPYEQDAMKRAMMRNMLEQHALRLKRGGFNSGFAHALRVRRGGIGQRSSWGHALRVRSSNMLNRGHALRIKRKPGDYRTFALRVRKSDPSFADEVSDDQGLYKFWITLIVLYYDHYGKILVLTIIFCFPNISICK